LVLVSSEFRKKSRSMFNPCINKSAKCLLYVRYQFRGLQKVLIYDFSRETLVIPHDL
jgi:hypothetical protein